MMSIGLVDIFSFSKHCPSSDIYWLFFFLNKRIINELLTLRNSAYGITVFHWCFSTAWTLIATIFTKFRRNCTLLMKSSVFVYKHDWRVPYGQRGDTLLHDGHALRCQLYLNASEVPVVFWTDQRCHLWVFEWIQGVSCVLERTKRSQLFSYNTQWGAAKFGLFLRVLPGPRTKSTSRTGFTCFSRELDVSQSGCAPLKGCSTERCAVHIYVNDDS